MDAMQLALNEFDSLSCDYRHLHMYPEISRHEVNTHAYIRSCLDKNGIEYLAPKDNITIAVIKGALPGKTCAIRSDTDALQVTEDTGLEYASRNPGVMHACGHDGHTAIGITCAKILNDQKQSLHGTVKVIFQPAEEGELGAQAVMDTGLVNDVNAFFGVHLWSTIESGELRVRTGGASASTDMFTVRITGRSGHGAMPEICVDPIVCASALVGELQHIVSRFSSPFEPVVVTIGSFHAGTRCNIIAGEAVLEGTIRTCDPEVYRSVHEKFDLMVKNTCESFGCKWEIDMRPACGVTFNDEKLCTLARRAAKEIGREPLEDIPTMIGDDFGDFRAIAPVCYMRVGVRNEELQAVYAHHHPRFRIDESALPLAAAWLVKSCEMYLEGR